jgi:hypothetical protein
VHALLGCDGGDTPDWVRSVAQQMEHAILDGVPDGRRIRADVASLRHRLTS